MWNDIFFVSIAAICVGCVILSISAAKRAAADAELLRGKLRFLESRIVSLETSRDESMQLLEELANRVKMMKVRNSTAGPRSSSDRTGQLPDPYSEPDAWRKAMTAKLALGKLNGG